MLYFFTFFYFICAKFAGPHSDQDPILVADDDGEEVPGAVQEEEAEDVEAGAAATTTTTTAAATARGEQRKQEIERKSFFAGLTHSKSLWAGN